MATCDYGGQDVMVADGCSDAPIVIEGQTYQPVRYGRERHYRGAKRRCGDCNVLPGKVHHHGCDLEVCPRGHLQSISCGCLWAGEEHLSDDWLEDLEDRFASS
jgi:hypothetical protein